MPPSLRATLDALPQLLAEGQGAAAVEGLIRALRDARQRPGSAAATVLPADLTLSVARTVDGLTPPGWQARDARTYAPRPHPVLSAAALNGVVLELTHGAPVGAAAARDLAAPLLRGAVAARSDLSPDHARQWLAEEPDPEVASCLLRTAACPEAQLDAWVRAVTTAVVQATAQPSLSRTPVSLPLAGGSARDVDLHRAFRALTWRSPLAATTDAQLLALYGTARAGVAVPFEGHPEWPTLAARLLCADPILEPDPVPYLLTSALGAPRAAASGGPAPLPLVLRAMERWLQQIPADPLAAWIRRQDATQLSDALRAWPALPQLLSAAPRAVRLTLLGALQVASPSPGTRPASRPAGPLPAAPPDPPRPAFPRGPWQVGRGGYAGA